MVIPPLQIGMDATGHCNTANKSFKLARTGVYAGGGAGPFLPAGGGCRPAVTMTRKEPFDWLDFSPGVTAIVNLDDGSYSMTLGGRVYGNDQRGDADPLFLLEIAITAQPVYKKALEHMAKTEPNL
ncbi:MAG: hypothetical protein PF442_12615 [Desulfobulbaceae bacterium]|jgi:hypothetical protein|nr:hypothetical protein [Desulfobulbaceae bacterium]